MSDELPEDDLDLDQELAEGDYEIAYDEDDFAQEDEEPDFEIEDEGEL
jgi:hypothetical protein